MVHPMTTTRTNMKTPTVPVPLAVLMLLFLASFGAALFGVKVLDDMDIVGMYSREPLAMALLKAATQPLPIVGFSYWRPLSSISLVLVGNNEILQHAFNLAAGILYVLGVWVLAKSLLPAPVREREWAVAALCAPFCLHPMLSEPFAWMSGRFDVLLALCVTWAIVAAARGKPLLAGALIFAGLLSKETALAFALGIPFVFLGSLPKREMVKLAASCGAAVAGWILLRSSVTMLASGGKLAIIKEAWMSPDAPLRFFEAVGTYASSIAAPWLFVDPIHAAGDIPFATALGGLAAAALVYAGVRGLARPGDHVAKALGVSAGFVAVVAATIGFDSDGFIIAGDRHLFPLFPLAAFAFFSSGVPARLAQSVPANAGRPLLICLMGALAIGSFQSSYRWNDEITLFSETFSRHPETNALTSMRLSFALVAKGRFQEAEAPSAMAERHWRPSRFSKSWPKDIVSTRAVVLIETGRPQEALALTEKWRGLGHDDHSWMSVDAIALAKTGRCGAAEKMRDDYATKGFGNPVVLGSISAVLGACRSQ